ncbi:hypothetical protein TTHERM_00621230 (macronuclear) [Tetrahymena thermophila SB210]|uniref:Uncharacterized protein n=1 Tax=Tetrahymena thermophila (strain SB210) TaxID=312017 RepID=Q23MD6_TETTS|nr:hypothetical protein TTHERM_00621230 [Tetrahymena thermophila SB210]EAR97703.1 hypothetical protein TTHERM_00621230 [Tetrahymena thermophila SB210]|eukprot:XP_001017948.1 hypothetical protein TTHERM_00621230 [Tetrahymena thermophila SB210]
MIFGEDTQNASCDSIHKTNSPLISKQQLFTEFCENRSLPSSYYECQGQLLRDDQVFNDILEETGRETLKITLDIQHKDHKEINKQFQATLMNYYLESYISPLLIQHMGLLYKREVFRKMKELAEKQMVEKQKKYIVLMNLFCQKIEQSQQTKEYVNILFEAISKPSPNPNVPQLEYCTFYRQRLCALILLQHYYTIQRETQYQNFYCFWHKLFEDQFPILQYIMEDKQLRKKLRMNTGIRVQAVPSLRNYMHKKQTNKNNIEEKGSGNSCQQMGEKLKCQKSSKLHTLNNENQSDEKIFKARMNNQRQSKKLQQTCLENQEKIQRKRQKVNKTQDQSNYQFNDDDNDNAFIKQIITNSAQKNIDCKIQNQFVKEVSDSSSKFKQKNLKQQELTKDKNLNSGESHLSGNKQNSNIYQFNEENQNKISYLDQQLKSHEINMQQAIDENSKALESQSAANKTFSLEKLAKRSKPRCSIEAGIQGDSLLSNENQENQGESNKKIKQSPSLSSSSLIPTSDSFLKNPKTTADDQHYQNNDYQKNVKISIQKQIQPKLKLESSDYSQNMGQEEDIYKNRSYYDGSLLTPFKNEIKNDFQAFDNHQNNIIQIKNLNLKTKMQNNRDKYNTEHFDDKGEKQARSQTTILKSEEQIADIQNQLTAQNSKYSTQQRFKNMMNSKLSEESTFMNSPQTNGQVFSFLESNIKEEAQKASEFKLGPSLVNSQNYSDQVYQSTGGNKLTNELPFKQQHSFNQKYPQISSLQVQNQQFNRTQQMTISQNNSASKFEQQVYGNIDLNQINTINNPIRQITCDNQIKVINMPQIMLDDQINKQQLYQQQQYQQYIYNCQQAQYESMQQQLFMKNQFMNPQYQSNILLNDQIFNNNNNNRIVQGTIFQGSNMNNLYQNNYYSNPNTASQIACLIPTTNDFQQMLINNQQCYFRSLLPSERAYNPQNQRLVVIQQIKQ